MWLNNSFKRTNMDNSIDMESKIFDVHNIKKIIGVLSNH